MNTTKRDDFQNAAFDSPNAAPSGVTSSKGDALHSEKKSLHKKISDLGLNSGFFVFCVILTLVGIIVYVTARISPDFAEFYSRYPASYLRAVIASVTSLIPFSVAECLVLLMPVIAVAYLVNAFSAMKRDPSTKMFVKKIKPLLCALLLLFSSFSLTFSTGYFRYSLAENLGLEDEAVSADQLKETAQKMTLELQELTDSIDFVYAGSSYMPYSYDELVTKINEAYGDLALEHDFLLHFYTKPKPIALSKPMTYTQIAGVYTFFTGEANININYPDYIIPFTVAHEMAHQRGISREDEANLTAFLVCMKSDDEYIQYSALLNIYEYVISALYKADKDAYAEVYSSAPARVRSELKAYASFFDKYKNETVSNVTKTVNNSFLQSQGQTEGVKSYGLVVDLIVAYYQDKE